MDDKRRRFLCYHCREKWHPQLKCKFPKVYLLQGQENVVEPIMELDEEPVAQQEPAIVPLEESEISLNAISGTPSTNTRRIVEAIFGHKLVVLVDLGSTHNFLHSSIAQRANLPLDTSKKLWVRISNGDLIQSGGIARSCQPRYKVTNSHLSFMFYH